MKVRIASLPTHVALDTTYVVTDDVPAQGAQYRVEHAAPKGTMFAGVDWYDYAIVLVQTRLGWSPVKTPARVEHVLDDLLPTATIVA